MSTMEPLDQVYLQHTVYDPPSLPLSSLEPGVLSNPDIHIVLSNSATVSEEKPHADLQALSVLELETLEESALHAFEYSDHVVVFGEKRFAVPVSSEINSFLKFKRAHPNSGGKAHVLTNPQRAMPACWNTAVQKPSGRSLLSFYWFAICTGKSLTPETNPWLDFVIFQNSLGIRCANCFHLKLK
ncbi:hypothetical protein BKA59DRAFT_452078 [Fusarium tricinctum]|uniref:Uncharacterized protein n=1 Tax=Fusarium tricinctum TaxID=61284 RepID=A0A8K0S7A2_9HYPO|nr:hypothetical protein BKA59DRAFT_452078 [Fusarium tricinctum]